MALHTVLRVEAQRHAKAASVIASTMRPMENVAALQRLGLNVCPEASAFNLLRPVRPHVVPVGSLAAPSVPASSKRSAASVGAVVAATATAAVASRSDRSPGKIRATASTSATAGATEGLQTPARVLPAETKLKEAGSKGFSLFTYNVLLPNSKDGWWIYKYYRDPKPEYTEWPARQAMLQKQLTTADSDIVCLQEVSDLSFEEDFSFMAPAGYTSLLHEKKGRMRPATFWKSADWELVSSLHRDRTLVTLLRRQGGPDAGRHLYVINCHLSAGPSADRRLRQVHEALEQAAKDAKKQGISAYSMAICGDFNSQGVSAVRELLVNGEVGPDFRESGDQTERGQEGKQLTSKTKKQTCGRFANAAECAFGVGNVPATILAANIDSKMLNPDNKPTEALLAAVNASFDKFASSKDMMDKAAVERWVVAINKTLGRGSEFRAAMAAMEARGGEELHRDDFVALYVSELEEGKFWGVEHDLRVMLERGTGLANPSEGPCQLSFDYIYFAQEGLQLVGVQEPLSKEKKDMVFSEPWEVLPNRWHPSDHLPVAAVFEFS
eukprot:TRINITY_DN6760_c0_g1_i1.p1 TRINITY_DN6760_c0_g1~~TRINITY_DN6760_c0_g1_i1.p1  ORF type:complete len:553 (+),score=100.85 TRINITY_DN6760_c0_g1_i1:20-1678(+)